VKVATWNVNSLTARWPRVEAWLVENNPDVVLIQETKQTDAKFPFVPLEQLGYQSAHYGQGQWNGVAIFSKVGLDDVTRGFGDEDPEATNYWSDVRGRAGLLVLRAQRSSPRRPALRLQTSVARQAR
jgi:exodeoxyribonuclease-3